MGNEATLSGTIPKEGMLEVLREVEQLRVTGSLWFTTVGEDGRASRGHVELLGGQIALDQELLPDGSDPVERLLALKEGRYSVVPTLPSLPVSRGDRSRRSGSLDVHVPADLMNYCEQAGLTGLLTLRRGESLVEIVYEHGELLAIRVNGENDGDLSEVFGWQSGTFEIVLDDHARDHVPDGEKVDLIDEPTPTQAFVRLKLKDASGERLLQVFEMPVDEIVEQRNRARPSNRPPAPTEGPPSVRMRIPEMRSPAPRKRPPLVKVVYLKPGDPRSVVPVSDIPRLRNRVEELRKSRPSTRSSEADALPSAPRGRSLALGDVRPMTWIAVILALGAIVLTALHRF